MKIRICKPITQWQPCYFRGCVLIRFGLLMHTHRFKNSPRVLDSSLSFTPCIQSIRRSCFFDLRSSRTFSTFLISTAGGTCSEPSPTLPRQIRISASRNPAPGSFRHCVRVILWRYKSNPVSPMFKNLQWLSNSCWEKVQILHYHSLQGPTLSGSPYPSPDGIPLYFNYWLHSIPVNECKYFR